MSLLNSPFDPAREAALVTGAGNGIGRAIAQALVGEGVRTVYADVNPDTVDRRDQDLAATGTGLCLRRRPRRSRRLRCAAGARTVGRRTSDAFRSQRVAAAARGRSRHGRQRRDLGKNARRQCRRRLSPRARTGATADRSERAAARSCFSPRFTRARRATCRTTRHQRRRSPCWSRNWREHGAATASASTRWCPARSPPAVSAPTRHWQEHIPLGRLGQAADLAPMALAVLSNKVSAYVTGADIVIDGGLSLMNWFEPPELGEL